MLRMASARRSFLMSFAFSRTSRRFSATSAAFGSGFRPRRLGTRPARVGLSRCFRHTDSRDERMSSRRSRAPSCPGSLSWSAFRRIHGLYSASNRRRTASPALPDPAAAACCLLAAHPSRPFGGRDGGRNPGHRCLTDHSRRGADGKTCSTHLAESCFTLFTSVLTGWAVISSG